MRERSRRNDEIFLELKDGETAKVDILVENMGRINYGLKLFDKKGIVGGIHLGQRFHFGWDHYSLPMEDLSGLDWKDSSTCAVPTFYRGVLNIDGEPKDTFLKTENFTKGVVFVNGFNLGRYYNPAGPTKTLYVPAPILKQGENEVVVFESDSCSAPSVEFFAVPDLG